MISYNMLRLLNLFKYYCILNAVFELFFLSYEQFGLTGKLQIRVIPLVIIVSQLMNFSVVIKLWHDISNYLLCQPLSHWHEKNTRMLLCIVDGVHLYLLATYAISLL